MKSWLLCRAADEISRTKTKARHLMKPTTKAAALTKKKRTCELMDDYDHATGHPMKGNTEGIV